MASKLNESKTRTFKGTFVEKTKMFSILLIKNGLKKKNKTV